MSRGPVAVAAQGWGWRHATRRAWALRGVDLTIAAGERVLLLGPSGSGKSTLLAGLAGLLDDAAGEQQGALLLDGRPARSARADGVRAGLARTGLLLQDPTAQTVLARCGDDVAFGLENHAVPAWEIWPRVERALRGVHFPYPSDHPTAALSGGERQRLALAGVLALRPGLLLLDEPTAMLDPAGAAVLRREVAGVLAATGATCVLVEHRLEPWMELVDRVIVLEPGGGVVAAGEAAQVLGAHGAALAAGGVWVPGRPPVAGRRRASGRVPAPEPVLSAHAVAVGRPDPARRARATQAGRADLTGADLTGAVLTGVELALSAGRMTCVTGPNGAGKSTLALALGGLTAPLAGQVLAGSGLAGGLSERRPHRWRARDLVTRIGSVFQEPAHQFLAPTVAAELAIGPRQSGLLAAPARAGDLLDRLRLGHLAAANPFTLSGGEQRRLSVATVLATAPAVLVLDEPTFGQDARTWAELVDLLGGLLDDGAAVVAVTHDQALVDLLSDDVLQLPGRRSGPQGPDPRGADRAPVGGRGPGGIR